MRDSYQLIQAQRQDNVFSYIDIGRTYRELVIGSTVLLISPKGDIKINNKTVYPIFRDGQKFVELRYNNLRKQVLVNTLVDIAFSE